MKKKFVASLLSLMLLLNCLGSMVFSPVYAEGTPITTDKIIKVIKQVEEKLPQDNADVAALYGYMHPYLLTDRGVNTLLAALDDPSMVPDEFQDAFNTFVGGDKNELKFLLNFIKCLPERATYLNEFYNDRKQVSDLSSKELRAVNTVFGFFISDAFETRLKDDFNIVPRTVMNLANALRGTFVLTNSDSGSDKVVIKSINSNFKTAMENNFADYTTVNDKTWSNGEDFLQIFVDELNSKTGPLAEIKDEIITIFTYLKLYEETEIAPTPDKTPDKTPKPTGGIKFPPTTSSSPTTPPASQTPGDKPQSIPKPPAAQDTQFADVNQHWSKDYAAPLVERNIIVGYEDGTFAPDQPITRQEFAVILVRALGLTEQAAALTDTGNFADGASIADWSKNSIALLSQMGILTGYDDGEFKPAKNISREEMAVLIARCVKNDDVKTVQTGFSDKDAISGWAAQDIEKVYSLGIISGYEDGSFKPAQNVTRAETCVMVYNYMKAAGLL